MNDLNDLERKALAEIYEVLANYPAAVVVKVLSNVIDTISAIVAKRQEACDRQPPRSATTRTNEITCPHCSTLFELEQKADLRGPLAALCPICAHFFYKDEKGQLVKEVPAEYSTKIPEEAYDYQTQLLNRILQQQKGKM